MDASQVDRFVGGKWDDEIVPQLVEYIRIPNKSPMFDADWVAHGYMEDAVDADGPAGRASRPSPACSSRWCGWKAARR